ncbi:MAG TPA: hypothetical protein VHO03_16790 [Ignavibacteriales bacterium]|nr:hypothetical protein [Ignavibacteriales bacterium]
MPEINVNAYNTKADAAAEAVGRSVRKYLNCLLNQAIKDNYTKATEDELIENGLIFALGMLKEDYEKGKNIVDEAKRIINGE